MADRLDAVAFVALEGIIIEQAQGSFEQFDALVIRGWVATGVPSLVDQIDGVLHEDVALAQGRCREGEEKAKESEAQKVSGKGNSHGFGEQLGGLN
jgi:hypothetical protein